MDWSFAAIFGTFLTASLLAQHAGMRRQRRFHTALSAAAHEASIRGHGHVTVDHVMLSLSFDEEIEALLASRGVDCDRVRARLGEELDRIPRIAEKTEPVFDTRVEHVIAMAKMRRLHPTARSLFDAIEQGPESRARAVLHESSSPSRGKAGALPPTAGPYRSPPEPPTTAIRYFNDHKTPAAFVIASLCEHVGLEASHACYLTYRVHFERSFVVARRNRTDAEALAAKITTAARAKGFPLRVTTEPIKE